MEDWTFQISSRIQSTRLSYLIQDPSPFSMTSSSSKTIRMKKFCLPSTREEFKTRVFFLSKRIKWEECIWKILQVVVLYAYCQMMLNNRTTIIPFSTSFRVISQSIVLPTIQTNALQRLSLNPPSYRWLLLFKSRQVGTIAWKDFHPWPFLVVLIGIGIFVLYILTLYYHNPIFAQWANHFLGFAEKTD